jgi:hypothetical protein
VASSDMPDAAFTHTVRGFFGEDLTIGAYPPEDPEDGGAVQFHIRDENGRTAIAHISSPAEREALARALMEAYRIADGEQPAMEAREEPPLSPRRDGCNGYCGTCAAAAQDRASALEGASAQYPGDDCGCGLGPERCAAAEDGDLGG